MMMAMHSSDVRGALPRPAPEAIEIRCPALETARAIREQWGPFCHLDAQDRRFRTVWLYEDTPQFVVDSVRETVFQDTEEEPRFGQTPLTQTERRELSRRDGWNFGTKGFHAMSCKAIAQGYGVGDWRAYYDQTLSVDEHRDVYPNVTGAGQSLRELDRERLSGGARDWRGSGGDD